MKTFRDEVDEAVRLNGPMCVELIECHRCHRVELIVHPFRESIQCDCGHMNASHVPVYNDEPFGK